MGTSGLVPAWCPFTDKERIIYAGLAERVLRETMAGMPEVPPDRFDWTPIDPERLKRVYDDLVTSHGAEVLFHTFIAGVQRDENHGIDTLIAASKSGLAAFRASVYVDCTGDADLAVWAGAEFHKGDEEGDLQPASLCFSLSNVDMDGYLFRGSVKREPNPAMRRIVESGKYPDIPDTHACNNIVGPGTVGFNAGHLWDIDNTDPKSVSRGMIQGRRMARAFRDALAEFFPEAFANAHLAHTAPLMGIRETRRIVGEYTLTIDDFRNLRSFPDEICRNCYFVDVHHKKSEIAAFNAGAKHHPDQQGSAVKVEAIRLGPGESHGVPYRCLTPKGLRNVLVAGRSISTDRPVQGSTRVMPVCLAMGEAAGIAAAMAGSESAHDVHKVSTEELRARLRGHGAYLPE